MWCYITAIITKAGYDDIFLICTSVLFTMRNDQKVVDYDGLTLMITQIVKHHAHEITRTIVYVPLF